MFNIEKYKEIRVFLEKNHKNTEILAISKNHPKEAVIQAIKHGVRFFGENRVLEAKSKFLEVKQQFSNIKLHLTGPLQSNKVKLALSIFDVFHTLDREKIAIEFSKNNKILGNKEIFIQVNIAREQSKSGIDPSNLKEFADFCKKDLNLNIVGLMCIPPVDEDPLTHFKYIQTLAKENKLNLLSIGMSNDYETALKFNPAYIRLGTVLFGKR